MRSIVHHRGGNWPKTTDSSFNAPRRMALRRATRNAAIVDDLESRRLLSTYYVATSGSDSGAGSAAAPWKTLQKAANAVTAGDTVHVGSGTYTTGMNIYGKAGGTASQPITFVADKGATITHAATSGTNASLAGINIESAGGYYVIQGFNIKSDGSMQRAGIRVSGSNNVTVINNTIDSAFIGIFASNTVNLNLQGNICSNSTDQHGIYVGAGTHNSIVRGNTMFGNTYDGLHLNASNAVGPNDGTLVEDNVIYGNNLSGIDAEGISNALIRNNIIYGNVRHGITIHSQDQTDAGDPTPRATGNVIVNNTIATASDSNGYAIQMRASDVHETIYNNVLIPMGTGGGSIGIASDSATPTVSTSGLFSDYNIVVDRFTKDGNATRLTLAQWRSQSGQDQHSIVSDAAHVLTLPSAGDFHLKAGSPAIDAGAGSFNGSSAPTADFADASRPSGAGLDIGAYESGSTVTPPTDTIPPAVSGVSTNSVQGTSANVAWTTNEAATTQVEFGTTTSYGRSTTLDSTLVLNHGAALTGLIAGTLYHYRVKSTDAAGNATVSGDFTFSTVAAPDTTAPTISGILAGGVSRTGATVAWTTNEPADGQVEYGLTATYGATTTLNTALSTSHSAALAGLQAGTVYHYRVESRDAAGNLTTSADQTFTTAAPSDTTPPSITGFSFDPRFGQTAVFTFSENVAASVAFSDFSLINVTTGKSVAVLLRSVSADGKSVTLSFDKTGGLVLAGAANSTVLTDGILRPDRQGRGDRGCVEQRHSDRPDVVVLVQELRLQS